MKGRALILMSCVFLAWLAERPAHAAIVSELDITGGAIDLDFGSLGHVADHFTKNGTLVMDQYQPQPSVFPSIQFGPLTFSIVTSATPGGFPVPTGQTIGSTMTVDLRSLGVGISSTQTPSWMAPSIIGSLNIGGIASGTFDSSTSEFEISWTRVFSGIPFHPSGTFTLQGLAQLTVVPLPTTPVPLPPTAVLLGTGVLGIGSLVLRRVRKSQT